MSLKLLYWLAYFFNICAGTLSFVPPVELELSKAVAIAPVTALFVAMLASTNACLRHVDIAFYQVFCVCVCV